MTSALAEHRLSVRQPGRVIRQTVAQVHDDLATDLIPVLAREHQDGVRQAPSPVVPIELVEYFSDLVVQVHGRALCHSRRAT